MLIDYNKSYLSLIVLALLLSVSTFAADNPKREVRAVWITTLYGLDWPQQRGTSATAVESQKHELCSILDKLQRANINTILFQTRLRATAVFPTNSNTGNEPWDACLSGKTAVPAGFDALQYAIDECHRRGMELHAWVVTLPAGKWNSAGCKYLRKTQPKLMMHVGDEGYLDPSKPGTATYLARYCADLTHRYDIDGIHLDYIRYPEQGKLPPAEQGRANITRIVHAISSAVKAEKGWVKMSCSPVGKYDDLTQYSSGGWNARTRVLQDAKAWVRDGLMDQLYPMMYFRGDNFYPFAFDWQEDSCGKTIAPGLGVYFMHPDLANWPLIDVMREMYVLRQQEMGFALFRSKFVTDNTKGFLKFLCSAFCQYAALTDRVGQTYPPEPPANLNSHLSSLPLGGVGGGHPSLIIKWQPGRDNSNGDYLTYNIYGSDTYPVDTNDAANLIATRVIGTQLTLTRSYKYYAVTAMDRYGTESEPLQQPAPPTFRTKPGWYYVTHPLG